MIWKRLYNTSSGIDWSTLYYFRNLLQHRSVTKKVNSDSTSSQDLVLLVLKAFVLHAVMSEFQMSSVDPPGDVFKNFSTETKEHRHSLFDEKMTDIVDKHFNFGKPKNAENE